MSDPIAPVGSLGQVPMDGVLAQPILPTQPHSKASSTQNSDPSPKSLVSTQGIQESEKATEAKNNKDASKGFLTPPSLDQATKDMQEFIKNLPSNLEFRKDESSGYTIFKVVNPITQEVIREYPPKEVVEMARRLKAIDQGKGSGVLIDQQS